MSYQCTLFKNTGFNAVNIPDSPALLASVGSPFTVPSLEIVQERFLSSIRVRTTWDAVKNVDYAKVGDFYYIVEGLHMLNGDTCELALLPDFITSAGGPGALTFIDGITERVKVSDDSYGKYNEEDELMTPAEPLQLSHMRITPAAGFVDLIESTIDLENNATDASALTYTDTVSGEAVTVPQNVPLTAPTDWTIAGQSVIGYTGVYSASQAQVKKGVQKARALGAESSIISHYKLPTSYGSVTGSTNWFSDIAGVDTDESINLPFRYGNYTPHNLKVLYASITKYGLLSMSGDRAEFSPADIYDGGTSPTVRIVSDPRPDGKPYFRYKTYLNDDSLDMFFTNSIGGAQWEQVPLVYTDKSGNALNRLQFEAEQAYTFEQTSKSIGENMLGEAFTGASRGLSGGGVIGVAAGTIVGAVTGAMGAVNIAREYQERAKMETLKYASNNLIIKPELTFPFNANMLREALGNGVVCYRYHYTDSDMQRIDKLLTMYGYKHSKALANTDFTNGTHFNYVRAGGVEVSGGLPRWWAEGIAMQLRAGTRVWHVAPSPTYYNQAN